MTTTTDVLDHAPLEAPAAGAPTRVVAPRTSLPSGRAVVGGLLIAVAALATFVAYRGASASPSTSYVVAAADLDPGTRLGASHLRLEPMHLPPGVDEGSFDTIETLDGAVLLAPLRAGELVQASALVPPGAGETAASPPTHEFSFAVERTRAVNGALNRGERVDLLATYGSGDTARTHVVVRDALVVDIDNEASDTIGSASTVTVTLALPSADEVLEAAHATQVAEVTLVRATKGEEAAAGDHLETYAGPGPSNNAGGDGGAEGEGP
jgi:Flp pilus assembly protein CpaB